MQTLSYGHSRDEEAATLVLQEPYRIGRPIGRGSLGWVCEASHDRLPVRLAVKVLSRELAGDAEVVERFCHEAEVLAQLHHPNMVQILDFNRTPDGLPYFVMEHLAGTDLARRLETGDPMLPTRVVQIVAQVASALAAAHARGILHRDLKPASIFLMRIEGQNDEFVKVLDLGMTPRRSTDRSPLPRYMAPEQALGQTERIDGRTDQFALAAITYAMLTGHDAFAGDDPAAVLYQVVHEQPPLLSRALSWDVSRLQAVISRGLAKDQDMRYDSVLDFARALEGAVFYASTIGPAVAPAVAPSVAPAVVVAAPPAPELAAAYAETAELPLRLPPAPKRAIATSKRRAVLLEGDDVDVSNVALDVDPVRPLRGSGGTDITHDWDLPSTIDRVPISPYRAVALAGVAATLCGLFIAKGWHRELSADVQFFRDNAVAVFRPPAPLPQPAAEPATGSAVAPARLPAPEAAPVAAPAPAAAPAERQPSPGDVPAPAAGASERPAPEAVAKDAEPGPRRNPGRTSGRAAAERRPDTRRSYIELLPPRPEPPPAGAVPGGAAPASPGDTLEPGRARAQSPAPAPAPSGASSGFSIAPPASQPIPDDIMPLGADGEPASPTGSEDRRPPPVRPPGTTTSP